MTKGSKPEDDVNPEVSPEIRKRLQAMAQELGELMLAVMRDHGEAFADAVTVLLAHHQMQGMLRMTGASDGLIKMHQAHMEGMMRVLLKALKLDAPEQILELDRVTSTLIGKLGGLHFDVSSTEPPPRTH